LPGTGGHLASNLGTVELTLACITCSTPRATACLGRRPQTYVHKILTGRRSGMAACAGRAASRVSAPRRKRVRCLWRRALQHLDFSGARHGRGVSSAWLQPARGGDHRRRRHDCRHGIEALNNAGATDLPLLVVLNDNDMSISPNVGALNNYLRA